MNQENLKYQLAYTPIPKCIVKEEPEDEESNSEIQMQNTENATIMGEENAVRRDYLVSSSSIPKCIVKEEPNYEDDGDECQLVAYKPLPHVVIKEESELGDGRDESHSVVHQEDAEIDQGSEHSSLEDLDESVNSLATDSTDGNIGLKESQPTAPERPFKCTECESSFKQKRTLNYHTKYRCGIFFTCKLCQKNLSAKHSLRIHLLTVHNVSREQLDKHGAGFRVRPTMPFKCERCERTYKLKAHLERHLKYECGVEPSFPCQKCDRRFKYKAQLKTHLIDTHNVELSQLASFGLGPVIRPEKPFKCDSCGKSYNKKKILASHLVVECGKEPSFACTLCDYRVIRKSNFKRHLQSVHGFDSSQLAQCASLNRRYLS